MSQIQASNLSFSYNGYEKVFDDVSFNIDTDWKLGLIGKNGKGKTTLLKLLLNEYKYQGKIFKNVNCEYFPYNVEDEKLQTLEVIQNIVPGVEDWKIYKELNLIEADADILYRPFENLSGGEKVKVLLVSLFLKENEFLLIDEPTNHLDIETRKQVEQYLNRKKGFILVSHDRNLLNNVVDHIISINNKDIEIQRGNYETWKENKDRQDEFEISQNEKLKKDINRLEESARQTSKWSDNIEKTKYNNKVSGLRPDRGYIGHQAAKMMQRSKSIESRKNKEIDEKEKLLKNIDTAYDLIMKPESSRKKELIIASDFQIRYSDKPIFKKQNFEVTVGDRVAITGKNGTGKTSIIKLILGEDIEFNGKISVANNLKISYVSQNTDEVNGALSQYAKKHNVEESVFRAMLQKLGVETKDFERDISQLSEGQKKKILIARSISESAELYIWDEPLNYIDILSREQIEKMILKYKPTIIFVEHDETFKDKVATKTIKLER